MITAKGEDSVPNKEEKVIGELDDMVVGEFGEGKC